MEGTHIAAHRKRMPSTRDSLTMKFEIQSMDGGIYEGYLTAGMYSDGTLGEMFLVGLGKFGQTIDGFAQWAIMDWSIAIQHGADFEMMCFKHANMKFEPRGSLVNTDGEIPIPYCHSIPALIAEWLALRFGEANGYPELHTKMIEIRENMRHH